VQEVQLKRTGELKKNKERLIRQKVVKIMGIVTSNGYFMWNESRNEVIELRDLSRYMTDNGRW